MSLLQKYRQMGTDSQLYLIFISFFWLYGYFGAFWRRIGIEPNIANTIFLFILAMACHGKWRHSVRASDIALYLIFVFLYFISAAIYPVSRVLVMKFAFEVLLVAAPFYFVGVIFKAEEYSYWLVLLSRLSIIINVIFSLFFSSQSSDIVEEMHRAYMILPSVLYLLWRMLESFKKVDLLFFAIGFFMLSSMGSRGPFVCVLLFALVYLFSFKEWKHKTVVRVVLILSGIVLYALSSYIAMFMVQLLGSIGLSTRIFDSILEDAMFNYENSNGRDIIQEELLQQLSMDYKGFGYGLFSDRIFSSYGFSAHNMIIELWFSFGYYIGSAILGLLLLLFVRFFIKVKDNHIIVFGLIIFTSSVVKLMFSDCFILDGLLFFLIGYCVNGLRTSKSKMIYKGATLETKIKTA